MSRYPTVLGELETLDRVLAGASLARYGDGELALCAERGIACQRFDPRLSDRLQGILHDSGDCLVGVPNIRSTTPKASYWFKYERFARFYWNRPYVSAFVTRPDSAPWIDTSEYWAKVEQLWVGQHVTLVRGGKRSFTAADLVGAASVTEIIAPREHAWADYHELMELIGTPERAMLCVGPTATVMAVDLCAKGVHAIDAGHLGMFYRKHVKGLPMVVTDEDKAA